MEETERRLRQKDARVQGGARLAGGAGARLAWRGRGAMEARVGGGVEEQRRHSGGGAASGWRRGARAATAVWIWKGRGGGVTDTWGPWAR